MKLKSLFVLNAQLLSNMGPRYVLYRLKHMLQNKTGVLKRRFPVHPAEKYFISLDQLRKIGTSFYWKHRPSPPEIVSESALKKQVQRILDGEYVFFSAKEYFLGRDYNWLTNPATGYCYDNSIHWSDIPDLSGESGDIKYVWEKSRFCYLQTIMRYDHHFKEDHSEWVFNEIDSWIAANPVNCGPNFRCSQEISIRLLNWSFVLHFYANSVAFTEERWRKYQHAIYWQLHHVYEHIDFSRIAVRNNHAITETGLLAVSHILFPFIPDTRKWAERGRRWLEEEVDYQVYKDGTFLQFSMNYHRVVVQLLTAFIALTEVNGQPFSRQLKEKAWKSVNFLYTCQETESGFLPNYGANDGALFFQWSSAHYRDFRPQLNALHVLLTGHQLYNQTGSWQEDIYWWGIDKIQIADPFVPLRRETGIATFPEGGYFVVREVDTVTFMRCGSHRDRPSQADNLHLDIWKGQENILRDGGSFLYNTDNETLRYFMGTSSHNTVMLNGFDQMLKGSRFIWYYWTQADDFNYEEGEDHYTISGTIRAFQHVSKSIRHFRKVTKWKNSNLWEVEDQIMGAPPGIEANQLWHGKPEVLKQMQAHEKGKRLKPVWKDDWYSSFYGIKEKGSMLSFPFKEHIVTRLENL